MGLSAGGDRFRFNPSPCLDPRRDACSSIRRLGYGRIGIVGPEGKYHTIGFDAYALVRMTRHWDFGPNTEGDKQPTKCLCGQANRPCRLIRSIDHVNLALVGVVAHTSRWKRGQPEALRS